MLPLRLRERVVARVSFPLVRILLALSPSELREWPRARAAMRRVGALGAPGPIGRWLDARLPAPYDEASDRVGYAEEVSSASGGALLGKRSGVRSPTA